MKKVSLLAAPGVRSRFYLQQLCHNNLVPARVYYLSPHDTDPAADVHISGKILEKIATPEIPDWLDPNKTIAQITEQQKIERIDLEATSPNDRAVIESVGAGEEEVVVYAGPGGVILGKEILGQGKKFLHVHPGYLPRYRGSTTIYYMLLAEGRCAATAFFFDQEIDTGPMLKRKYFSPPENRLSIDLLYDPFIRSECLISVMEDYIKKGKFEEKEQPEENNETYYIIHPVLKHVAILKGFQDSNEPS